MSPKPPTVVMLAGLQGSGKTTAAGKLARLLKSQGLGVLLVAADRAGLLAALTAVIERAGADIAWAKITTLGSSLIDVFAVTLPAGVTRQALERDLYAVLPAPPTAKPVQEAG
jgi:signal recognition particle GTPase